MTDRPRRARAATAGAAALLLAATMTTGLAGAAEAKPKKGGGNKAVFATTEIVSGAGVVSVTGSSPGRKRKISLQVKTKGAWVTLARKKADKKGDFAIAAPFNWYGAHRLRVTTRGFTKAKKVRVTTSYAPFGDKKKYVFITGDPLKRTPRFNPCQTLKYQVNAAQVPPNALPIVQSMMAQISAATGIETKYLGPTSYVPFATKKLPARKADLVIGWARDAEVPGFASSDGTVGLGGALRAVRARDTAGRSAVQTTQAGVVLQTEAYTDLFREANDSSATNPPVGRLILHEVGHALGLGHTDSAFEVMYFTNWSPEPDGLVHARYGLGDLSGLRKLGLEQGCLKPTRRAGRYTAAAVAPPVADDISMLHGRQH